MDENNPGRLNVKITLSTGAWLLIMMAFAVGFGCGHLVEDLRDLLYVFFLVE